MFLLKYFTMYLLCVLLFEEFSVVIKPVHPDAVPITVNINGSDTVKMLKEQIQDKTGLDAKDFLLVFQRKQMEDVFQVKDFYVEANSVIHLVQI